MTNSARKSRSRNNSKRGAQRRARTVAARVPPVLDEEHEDAEAEQRDEEGHDEHRVIGLRRGSQDEECDDRARDRAGRVERAVHTERSAEPLRRRAERDERVARRAIRTPLPTRSLNNMADAGTAALRRGQQSELGPGRHRVPGPGDFLVPLAAIGDHAADHGHQPRDAEVDAVEQPELELRQPELEHEVYREDGRHHLRRDVGEEAREAERDHVCAHPRRRPVARVGSRRRVEYRSRPNRRIHLSSHPRASPPRRPESLPPAGAAASRGQSFINSTRTPSGSATNTKSFDRPSPIGRE